jgi:hypothetical protein
MLTDLSEILKVWLDEDDWEPFELINNRGESASFEQIAVFQHDDGTYCISRPVDNYGNPDGATLIFIIYEEGGEYKIDVVTDEFVQDMIYDEYRETKGADVEIDDFDYDEDEDEGEDEEDEFDGKGYRVYDAEDGDADLASLDATASDSDSDDNI